MSQENYLYYLEKAIESFKNKDYDKAMSMLDEALQQNYDVPQLHFWMGKIYSLELTEERLNTAIISFSQAVQLKPDYEEAYLERGRLYLKTGEVNKAIKDLEKVIQLNPSNKEAYLLLAQAYFSKGNKEKALNILKNITGEKSLDFYIQMAKILIETENFEEAISYIERGKKLDNNAVILYELSAKAYEGMQEYIKAIEELQTASYLNPSEDRYFKQIAIDLLKLAEKEKKQGNIKKSAKYIAMAVDVDYDVPINDFHKNILKEAIKSCILENQSKQALSFIDCIERIAQYEPEINQLKKQAIKNLPLKDKIIRLLTDIYTK